jgi:ribosomal-protein-alanine N-acetyltransferase
MHKIFPKITTKRLILKLPELDSAQQMCDFVVQNKEHLSTWEPIQKDDYYTQNYWQKKIAEIRHNFSLDKSCCLNIYAKENNQLIGVANYDNFIRGAFHSCFLGFKISKQAQGQGLMTEALQASIDYVFATLNLHRIAANYMPRNEASARVLAKCGFEQEGVARDYLCIGGKWEEHVLCSLTNRGWVEVE